MTFFDQQETARLNAIVERGRKTITQGMLQDLMHLAWMYKSSGYDDHQAKLRRYYEGRQYNDLKAELQRRYPKTFHKMHMSPFNLVKHVGQTDASVYDYPLVRMMVLDEEVLRLPPKQPKKPPPKPVQPSPLNGKRPPPPPGQDKPPPEDSPVPADGKQGLPAAKPAAVPKAPPPGEDDAPDEPLVAEDMIPPKTVEKIKAFNRMLQKSKIQSTMVEMERRTCVSQTQFMRLNWDYVNECVKSVLFWPNAVNIVPDPWDPSDLNKAVAVVIVLTGSPTQAGTPGSQIPGVDMQVTGSTLQNSRGRKTWYEVWTRPREYVKGEAPKYGPWQVEQVSSAGDSINPFGMGTTEYPLSLPIVTVHNGLTFDLPYLDNDRDLVAVVDSVNVSIVDMLFMGAMQAHSQLVYKGNRKEGKEFALGPGVAARIGTAESLEAIDMNPKITEVGDMVKLMLKILAVVRSQSPGAYSVDDVSARETGIAKQIGNEPQAKARRERKELYRDFEESQLLPKMTEIYDEWGPDDPIMEDGLTFQVTVNEPPEAEELVAKQTRLLELQDKGYISKAGVAVQLGIYSSVEDAVDAGLPNELEVKAPPPMIPLPGITPVPPGHPMSPFQKDEAGKRAVPVDTEE